MKIRAGFVSNSSSSSFVLIGTPIKFDDVLKLSAEEQKKIVALHYDSYEGCLSEFKLERRVVEEMKVYPDEIDFVFDFVNPAFAGWESGKGKLPAIEEGMQIQYGTMSMHSELAYAGGVEELMKAQGYGDLRSEEEKRLEELLDES